VETGVKDPRDDEKKMLEEVKRKNPDNPALGFMKW
jgi:hypothetical protein